MQVIILLKNMFACPLKFILKIFEKNFIFSIKPKYSYIIMYEYKKSQLTHISYLGLFNFSHLNLFYVNIIYKK